MRYSWIALSGLLITAVATSCSNGDDTRIIDTIAFGSCGEQYKDQPVLALAAQRRPGVFVFLGDNIYGDTYNMDTLRIKYNMLGAKPEFQKLKESTEVLATWDDHDYGWNDSGRHYPFKEESKQIFLDFFGVPDPAVTDRDGIYYSKYYRDAQHTLQVIVLDLRTFRDNLLPHGTNTFDGDEFDYVLDYRPHENTDSTLLGDVQWQWLEAELQKPADIRLIASSTQFGITYNGYEAWANFPHEQKRMIDLIKQTRAEGVVFISGDVHYAEISRLEADGLYPLYDVTSSGITSTWGFATPNGNRIDGPVMENNFGLITIDWQKDDPEILMEVI